MTRRAVTTLDGTLGLRLQVRRCRDPICPRFRAPPRPEQEEPFALPEYEFGLDIIALVGTLRHAQHRSAPEIHADLTRRGVPLCLRDVLSGEVLLARSLLSSTAEDLARLLTEVKGALGVPIVGVISDGQDSIRKAVKKALDGVPHQLRHFHYLREAAKPIDEADRHAKRS